MYQSSVLGLDISDLSLRLIQLKKKKNKILLTAANEITLPASILKEGVVLDKAKLIENIKKLIQNCKYGKVRGKEVVSCLPETKTFIKVLELMDHQIQSLETVIKEESKSHLPFSLEEIYLDWQIIETKDDRYKVLVGAAPKTIVDNYISIIKGAGLEPIALEIEAAAITRALILENDTSAVAVIDLGARRSSFILWDFQTIQFSISLPVSGQQITETIAKSLKIDIFKAEQVKKICGLSETKCRGILKKALMPITNELIKRIKEALKFYQAHFASPHPLRKIILCGGGAYLNNLTSILSSELKIETESGNPWLKTNDKKVNRLPQPLSYTTAIGLALRGITI